METKTYILNDNWFIATDPDNTGISDNWQNAIQESCIPAFVPSIIQQFFPSYHGVAWYWNTFKNTLSMGNDRVLLRFGGVDYKATVWLNGVLLGSYEGGETPFDFDVTDYLKEDNLLAVRVLNPTDKMIDGAYFGPDFPAYFIKANKIKVRKYKKTNWINSGNEEVDDRLKRWPKSNTKKQHD
jgi:beta-galactosidase/beta-glucuronidase